MNPLYRIRSALYWNRIARERAAVLRRNGYEVAAPLLDRIGALIGVGLIGAALGAAAVIALSR
jgi:hypothetical protein